MTRFRVTVIACAAGLAFSAAAVLAQGSAPKVANPELVGQLAKELGSTPAQAEGAAGSLFGLAKSRLKPEEFAQVAKAVPVLTQFVTKSGGAGVGNLLAGVLK